MKVWIVNDLDHGEVSVWAEDTDVLEIPFVKRELGYLEGPYEDERLEFVSDVHRASRRGSGSAMIDERVRVELVPVEILA